MDVYLVDRATSLIYNCIAIESVEIALEMYPQYLAFERTASNAYLNSTPETVIEAVANDEPITDFIIGDQYRD
tara:strand:- start:504 stop:722 length:219 start_codon:yes stop_codon:yes gene_type:complete